LMSGLDDFIWDELQPKLRELGRLSEGVDAAAGELRAYIIRRLQLGIAESDVARRWLSLVLYVLQPNNYAEISQIVGRPVAHLGRDLDAGEVARRAARLSAVG